MIAVSIFFSSSPFSIVQNYVCIDKVANNKTIKICGNELRSDELDPVASLIASSNISDVTPSQSLSVIQNGSVCNFNNEVVCLGEQRNNGHLTGTQYIVKQQYSIPTGSCDLQQNITYYYTDCTIQPGKVCVASRCVKYKYQVTFYELMERWGFRP